MEAKKIKIGWSEVDLTPPKKIKLDGQFYARVSQFVETPITVTAMALDSGDSSTIICSVDIAAIFHELMEGVRAKISEMRPDIDADAIILAATHTHTSFVYGKKGGQPTGIEEILGKLSADKRAANNTEGIMDHEESLYFITDKIVEAVIKAWDAREEGGYANGFGRAAVGMCRRVCYEDGSAKMWGDTSKPDFTMLEGGNDNGIELLFTYDKNDKLTGVVANIACPAQILEQRYFISSDYWGKVKIKLREKLGEDLMVLGLCSPAGDQCPRDLVRWIEPETPIEDPNVIRDNPPSRRADPSMYDIKGSWTVGRRVSTEILAILDEGVEIKHEAELAHKKIIMDLPLRTVTEEERAAAQKAIDEFIEETKNREINFFDTASTYVHAGTVKRYVRQQTESIVPTEVHIVRFGDIAFASNPFELFLDFGNLIRAHSKAKQTFLMQLTCDWLGYLPTEKAEKGGHYSAYVSSGNVGHEGGLMLARNTVSEIEKMFE
ncbi:MAG: hypothetical protein J6Q78_03205 [Clostridia bacterium]|nr:hypothetical protein [Clostridia bacterium]